MLEGNQCWFEVTCAASIPLQTAGGPYEAIALHISRAHLQELSGKATSTLGMQEWLNSEHSRYAALPLWPSLLPPTMAAAMSARLRPSGSGNTQSTLKINTVHGLGNIRIICRCRCDATYPYLAGTQGDGFKEQHLKALTWRCDITDSSHSRLMCPARSSASRRCRLPGGSALACARSPACTMCYLSFQFTLVDGTDCDSREGTLDTKLLQQNLVYTCMSSCTSAHGSGGGKPTLAKHSNRRSCTLRILVQVHLRGYTVWQLDGCTSQTYLTASPSPWVDQRRRRLSLIGKI